MFGGRVEDPQGLDFTNPDDLHVVGIFEHGIEHALATGDRRLPDRERLRILCEKPLECDHGRMKGGHRAAAGIPRE